MLCNYLIFLMLCVWDFKLLGQNTSVDSSRFASRLRTFTLASAGIYGTAIVGMNQLWYKNYPRSSFHFFNDNAQWKQLDKVGHGYTAFYLSELNYNVLHQIGLPEKQAIIWSGVVGFLWMLPIEILDGFSAGYGASSGDLLANFSGSLLFTAQKLLTNQIIVRPKFAFRRSGLAGQRPEVLGKNLSEEMIKDYNAQIYRFSFDIKKMIKSKRFPAFINLAFGYGGGNMLYGQDIENQRIGINPYRRYQVGLDWNLSGIRTKSRILKSVLYVLDAVSLPAPTLELRKNKRPKFTF